MKNLKPQKTFNKITEVVPFTKVILAALARAEYGTSRTQGLRASETHGVRGSGLLGFQGIAT